MSRAGPGGFSSLTHRAADGTARISLMMGEIFVQPWALRRTFQAEREHAESCKDFARRQGFRLIVLVARVAVSCSS